MTIIKPRKNKPIRTKIKDKEYYCPPVPEWFSVVIDTREQLPYVFSGISTVTHKLDAGDYSVSGYESEISIERKSVSDFYGSITRGRERFKSMLKRLHGYRFKGIVIEEKEDDVLCPEMFGSGIHRNSIYASIISFEVRYGVHMYYGDHNECENKILNWLIYFYNMRKKEKKEV